MILLSTLIVGGQLDPVIIPYKAINLLLATLFGIITGSLAAKFSLAMYNYLYLPQIESYYYVSWTTVTLNIPRLESTVVIISTPYLTGTGV